MIPQFAHLPSALQAKLSDHLQHTVDAALAEDLGSGDLTAQLITGTQSATASIISREPAVICGIPWVDTCFERVAPGSSVQWQVAEGDQVAANQTLCEIHGNARGLLSAERCALNFLQTLSGAASVTRLYVDAVAGTPAHIMDTRKTIPGLRLAQKYAVTVGGGMNQRLGLYDGILIKENHIAAAGGIAAVLRAAASIRNGIDHEISIQIEVETLAQLQAALDAGAQLILLDNFQLDDLHHAVAINARQAILEASGGLSLHNVRQVALTGVDRISIGSLTKHLQALDLSMRFNGI